MNLSFFSIRALCYIVNLIQQLALLCIPARDYLHDWAKMRRVPTSSIDAPCNIRTNRWAHLLTVAVFSLIVWTFGLVLTSIASLRPWLEIKRLLPEARSKLYVIQLLPEQMRNSSGLWWLLAGVTIVLALSLAYGFCSTRSMDTVAAVHESSLEYHADDEWKYRPIFAIAISSLLFSGAQWLCMVLANLCMVLDIIYGIPDFRIAIDWQTLVYFKLLYGTSGACATVVPLVYFKCTGETEYQADMPFWTRYWPIAILVLVIFESYGNMTSQLSGT